MLEFLSSQAFATTVIASASAYIAYQSFKSNRTNFDKQNRPWVVSWLDEAVEKLGENAEGNPFNIYLRNTGARAALAVRISVEPTELRKFLHAEADEKSKEMMRYAFSPENFVTVINPGEQLSSSFGYNAIRNQPQCLIYRASFKIKITYEDVDGRTFSESQLMRVAARKGFVGGVWS